MKEIIIESIDNAKIKYLRKICSNNSFAKKEALYMVETQKLIEELDQDLNVDIVYNIYLDSSYYNENAKFNFLVSKKVFESISEINSKFEQICFVDKKSTDFNEGEQILVLDNVQDPGNMGTLIRSANAFNFKNILCINSCSIFSPKVIRSAKGSLFDVNVKSMNMEQAITFLTQNQYEIIGTDLYGSEVSQITVKSKKFALVLGNEGNGMSNELKDVASGNVKIETSNVESLNVGVAGSILMYEFNKIKY